MAEESAGLHSPRTLASAVFFAKLSQFSFGTDLKDKQPLDYVVYTENGSKNRSGSYKDKSENKHVKHYANPSLKGRCFVFLLKFYFSKLPKALFDDESSVFYWQPKEQTPPEGIAWFNSLHAIIMSYA